MPATEQTWRNQKLLHFVFAASGVGLLLSTFWMFADDHQRSWKDFQRTSRAIDMQTTRWSDLQYETDEYAAQRAEAERKLAIESARPISSELLGQFAQEVDDDGGTTFDRSLDAELEELNRLATRAAESRAEASNKRAALEQLEQDVAQAEAAALTARQAIPAAADPDAATQEAESKAATATRLGRQLEDARNAYRLARETAESDESEAKRRRDAMLAALRDYVRLAKFREDRLLGQRKFKSATRDSLVAEEGLAVRDEREESVRREIQAQVDQVTEELGQITLQYQQASRHRQDLEKILDRMTAEQDAAQKELETVLASRKSLEDTLVERRSTYFVNRAPWLGKKWLELPILDAFNSPLKISNLWSDGLTINNNFGDYRRYDRCTTCHQVIDKGDPGSSSRPAYVEAREIRLVMTAPTAEELAEIEPSVDEAGNPLPHTLEDIYGFRLAGRGLLDHFDVTVSYVAPRSLAARAVLSSQVTGAPPLTGEQLQESLFRPDFDAKHGEHGSGSRPGLMFGDVLLAINGDRVMDDRRTATRLIDLAGTGESVELTVRRGLPNPYAGHPRLDLFLGSMSPHKLSDFACTICHDGQGSATDFKWASHTPNDLEQQRQWEQQYGWFDNHHWIFPMYPRRFVESACLKCHHEVVDLEPSERFPDPPAPKVVHGYNLVRKYGCFGCHEINGYESGQRIGPDLRLEPNFFAVAQQLKSEPGFARTDVDGRAAIDQLVYHPEDDETRREVLRMLEADQQVADSGGDALFSSHTHQKLAPLLKDIETPGTLRKVGPALRFVGHKLDQQFLYDWIRQPKHFRPTTRMPQFFGLFDHLPKAEDEPDKEVSTRDQAARYEAVEIQAITAYLLLKTQEYEYLERPAWSVPAAGDDAAKAEQIARGKTHFQLRCIACHTHKEFPEAAEFNSPDYIPQGPDLSGIGDKFDPARNPDGPAWLYSWIKRPNRYHVRTVMPNLFLDPFEDAQGDMIDPAADVTEFLLADSKIGYEPAAGTPTSLTQVNPADLKAVALEFLEAAFFTEAARNYVEYGVPAERQADLKGAEVSLVVSDEDYRARRPLSVERKLLYVGQKVIAKHGCYACHDIPGFEDAKPIGTTLTDWGRKDPSKLAFEHIAQYLAHQTHDAHDNDAGHAAEAGHDEGHQAGEASGDPLPGFYADALAHGHRAGFMYQKLREPRSYDYHKTENKKYNERLRMPMFPLDHDQREAIITFVLGLVAEPPSDKYIYKPSPRHQAIIDGRRVLDQYNCAGCHVLELERWRIAFPEGYYGEQPGTKDFPFLRPEFTSAEVEASRQIGRRGLQRAVLHGMPALVNETGRPAVYDEEGDPVEEDEPYDPLTVEYPFDLWRPVLLGGNVFDTGVLPLNVPAGQIEKKFPSRGGYLAKYLLPHAVEMERAVNPAAKGTEAWGWLPPPLVGQGHKTQADWLHDFLLRPHEIRPAVLLRMPNFYMSSQEATKLVEYFAAVDNAQYPHQYSPRRQQDRLVALEQSYRSAVQQASPQRQLVDHQRFHDAMRIITNSNYCIKCHLVGDFVPEGSDRAKAPDLSVVYNRLKPEYVRDWVAKPIRILPYTSMPVNIPFDPDAPNQGGISQDVFHGTSIEQLDALVDVLMNFDAYAKQQTNISEIVRQNAPPAVEAATPDPDVTGAGGAAADATSAGDAAGDGDAVGDGDAGGTR